MDEAAECDLLAAHARGRPASPRRRPTRCASAPARDDLGEAFLRSSGGGARERRAITLATAARVLRQLRRDPRTLALLLVVPPRAAGAPALRLRRPADDVFHRIGAPLLGFFPFISMFLVTSIAMLRERTTGTLERLMTMPLAQARPARAATRSRSRWSLRVQASLRRRSRSARSASTPPARCCWSSLLAVRTPLLGMALGLFVSAFATTEFQAVQFMPAIVLPQLLLCGLFVARERDGRLARGDLGRAAADLRLRRARAGDRAGRPRTRASPSTWSSWSACTLVALALGAATLRRRTP